MLVALDMIIICAIILGLIRYGSGPFSSFRELIVTTSMTTLNHKYIASVFASDEEIQKIMDENSIKTPQGNSNISDIQISSLDSPAADKSKIELIDIKGSTFAGYMLIVHDPSRVRIVSNVNLNKTGMKLGDIVKKYNAAGGINAGGFVDEGGTGFGGTTTGCIIENSQVKFGTYGVKYNIIGFNKDNILVLGRYTLGEAQKLNIRDAVEFEPFIVVNGEPVIKHGDGGWGLGPRTAIGQTKDGKVIMITIDGRQLHSVGATLKDVQDIMVKYNAFNASILDGGSSSVMYYQGKLINKPSSIYGERFLPSAFIID